jgi:SsrA-binding protein
VNPRASDAGQKTVATNRHALRDYQILDRLEAGITLNGSEVKSLRGGKGSLSESFARVRDGEVWLENMHIPPYEQGEKRGYDPLRPRKLLLHRGEIERLVGKSAERGLTLVPMRVYFTHGLAKVELGLGKGKQLHDKRETSKQRDWERDRARLLRDRG